MIQKQLLLSLLTATLFTAGCSFEQYEPHDAALCEALWEDAQSKKGNPLQRSAAMDRYRTACTGNR